MCRPRTNKGEALNKLGQIVGEVRFAHLEDRPVDLDRILSLAGLAARRIRDGWLGPEFTDEPAPSGGGPGLTRLEAFELPQPCEASEHIDKTTAYFNKLAAAGGNPIDDTAAYFDKLAAAGVDPINALKLGADYYRQAFRARREAGQ